MTKRPTPAPELSELLKCLSPPRFSADIYTVDDVPRIRFVREDFGGKPVLVFTGRKG